jgi:hypothetical protein
MNEEIALGKPVKGTKVTREKPLGTLQCKMKTKRENKLKKTEPKFGRRIRSSLYVGSIVINRERNT